MGYKNAGGVAALAMAIAVVTILNPSDTVAVDESLISSPSINISKVRTLGANELYPTALNGNIDCQDKKITTRPKKVFPQVPIAQTALQQNLCMTSMRLGSVGNNYLEVGGGTAGQLYDSTGTPQYIIPSPNSSTGVFLEKGASSGSYISLVYDLESQLKISLANDYTAKYNLKPGTSKQWIKNTNGQNLALRYESIAFSADGSWMVADAAYLGQVRVNLTTSEVKVFGYGFPYDNGLNPGTRSTISSDGRYVAVSSGTYNFFKIFDLQNCATTVNGVEQCASRDLWPQMRQVTENKGGISQLRFLTPNYLRMFAGYREGDNIVRNEYGISTGDTLHKLDILGLGDSFTSGEGAGQYKEGTATATNTCHLSGISYPYLASRDVGANSSQSVACSGAKNEDIKSDVGVYDGQDSLDLLQENRALDTILNNYSPGQILQSSFVTVKVPRKILVSIGGNDINFGKKILSCVLNDESSEDTCFNTYEQRVGVINEIKAQIEPLRNTYVELKKQGSDVYVVGYPKIVKAGGGYCKANVHLNDQETILAGSITELLNDAVETATKQAGVKYVDVEDSLAGHRLCESPEQNLLAVHGITAGKDRGVGKVKFISAESFHPNKLGQELIAKAVIDKSFDMKAAMPTADPNAIFPELPSTDPFLTSFPATGYSVAVQPRFVDLGIDSALQKSIVKFVIKNPLLKPNTPYRVVGHSTPVDITTVTTNSDGIIDTEITLPPSMGSGYHSLHLLGQSIFGEELDLYDYFLISAYENDFDGDGVLDENEQCIVLPSSGIDVEADGIDDTCDGEIGPARQNIVVPPEEIIVLPEPPGLPNITPIEGEADKDGLGESVAGLEVLVTPEPEPAPATSQPATTPAVTLQRTAPGRAYVPNNTNDNVVLGQTGALDSASTQSAVVPKSVVNDIVASDVVPKQKPNYTLYWVLAGFGGLLIVFIVARAYSRVYEENN